MATEVKNKRTALRLLLRGYLLGIYMMLVWLVVTVLVNSVTPLSWEFHVDSEWLWAGVLINLLFTIEEMNE